MDRSLEVRLKIDNPDSLMEHFNDITRPARGKPDPSSRVPSTGEVQSGAVLYKDRHIVVTFLGMTAQDQAKIRILNFS